MDVRVDSDVIGVFLISSALFVESVGYSRYESEQDQIREGAGKHLRSQLVVKG